MRCARRRSREAASPLGSPRRTGSGIVTSSRERNAPGMPTMKNTACQERTSPITGSAKELDWDTRSTIMPPKR